MFFSYMWLVIIFAGCAVLVPGHATVKNKQCLACHSLFEKEKFSQKHAQHNVSCAKCHGPSMAHINDERSQPPPDIMYPRDKIKAACFKCHKESKLAKKSAHQTAFAPTSTKVCTDCHGKKHRVKEREVRWDKVTRKVLPPAKK
jgi:hypothetical protein